MSRYGGVFFEGTAAQKRIGKRMEAKRRRRSDSGQRELAAELGHLEELVDASPAAQAVFFRSFESLWRLSERWYGLPEKSS